MRTPRFTSAIALLLLGGILASSSASGSSMSELVQDMCFLLRRPKYMLDVPLPLEQGSAIIDTNITLLGLRKLRTLFDMLPYRDIRVSSVVQSEVDAHHGSAFKVPGFKQDKVPALVRQRIRDKLDEIVLGGVEGQKDREIVTDVFCAKTADGSTPVLITGDSGVFGKLYRLKSNARQEIPFDLIPRLHFPRGFYVTLENRRILVVPVNRKMLEEIPPAPEPEH